MSRTCEKCGKSPSVGFQISHSMRHTKRRFLPNLITKKVTDSKGKAIRMRICTRCQRTMAKASA
ncbi:50S ribosomal protein L28 [Candidatus Peregrinibacteria bacterium]|nr:50S ribosomal protein L28 [Candidatus Peregrinibacteria bacterium]